MPLARCCGSKASERPDGNEIGSGGAPFLGRISAVFKADGAETAQVCSISEW
jgi:hypothetical protein